MCKVCELEAEVDVMQDELNHRVRSFVGELQFDVKAAGAIREVAVALFSDLLDKLELIEHTRDEMAKLGAAVVSDTKH